MFVVFFFPGLTKKRYVETVIKAIQQCKKEGVDIDVRWVKLLLFQCATSPGMHLGCVV